MNTIIEYGGPVADVQPRYFAAHEAAAKAIGCTGVPRDEFWRLWRTQAADGQFVRLAKARSVIEYTKLRTELINSDELIQLDEPQPGAAENLRVLKQLGSCHLVTLSRNGKAINDALDRMDLWVSFNSRLSLPEDRQRRVEAIRQLAGAERISLAIAGTVAFAYAAGEAGCRVVGMKNGPAVPKLLRQVGVDVFYESLDELTNALTRRDADLQRIGLF